MRTDDFDYSLPSELIAQTPIEPRDQARLMVLDRSDGSLKHRRFFEIIDYFQPGDILVFNDSRVIPARLNAKKLDTGGKLEILLLRRLKPNVWETLIRPSKRIKTGSRLNLINDSVNDAEQGSRVLAEVVELRGEGVGVIRFSDETCLPGLGMVALPPYIHVPLKVQERYQTVYSRATGSIAAPTAGLHFTLELIDNIKRKGIQCLFVTLHIGLDTFRPVWEDDPREHSIHREYGVLSQEVAERLSQAKAKGQRVICAGTTTVRLVEAAARAGNLCQVHPFEGWVSLFILPGYRFRIVDALITNFHLPKSTLLMLVSAFAGKDVIRRAYQEAINQKYRFYSFGDAMLIL